jgi:hypothetical protein
MPGTLSVDAWLMSAGPSWFDIEIMANDTGPSSWWSYMVNASEAGMEDWFWVWDSLEDPESDVFPRIDGSFDSEMLYDLQIQVENEMFDTAETYLYGCETSGPLLELSIACSSVQATGMILTATAQYGSEPYTYVWRRSTSGPPMDEYDGVSVGSNTPSFQDTGLTPNTHYYYACFLTDLDYNSVDAYADATTLAAPATGPKYFGGATKFIGNTNTFIGGATKFLGGATNYM